MRRKGATTLTDVAKHAGVSVMSASAVLNNSSPGTRVGPATRERILSSAKDLGYTPNRLAQSLRNSRSNIIGLYTQYSRPGETCLHFHEVLLGATFSAAKVNRGILFFPGGEETLESSASLLNGHIDGLVVFASSESSVIRQLLDLGVPMVAHTDAISEIPSVVVDDEEGGRLQARHLVQKGRRSCLYRPGHRSFVSGNRRQSAFIQEAEALGMKTTMAETPKGPSDSCLSPQDLSLLTTKECDSVVCFDDHLAYATLDALKQARLNVPSDISLIGFNGVFPSIGPENRITTIQAPWKAMAELAVESLIALINGERIPQETRLPVKLVPGSTT
jgi:DNA-binding LacI/PurR family transcriptional regulator